MRRSTDRILTTHAGSLPRPTDLLPLVLAKEAGEEIDAAKLEAEVAAAAKEVVRQQVETGIDVLNDGEVSKPSYATYVQDRLTGFGGEGSVVDVMSQVIDLTPFPDYVEQMMVTIGSAASIRFASCDGPISYADPGAVETDVENLKAAASDASPEDVFMTAASPGVISVFFPNHYYKTEEEYLGAISDAMRTEYEAINRAGLVLQLDCPDLAMTAPGEPSLEAFRKKLEMRIEALNAAVANIPAEDMRIHICWGNGEMPRDKDVALRDIIDILLKAKPAGMMLMASNGRHAHEWKVFQDVKLPDGKYVIPGVLDSTSNIIEHPEVVAERLVRYAGVVGRENVMAGTDCGFGTMAGMKTVAATICWAKFQSMREGAALATKELW